MFCNLVPPTKAHKDTKDVKWCVVFYCGPFEQTFLHLYYQNIYIYCVPGDVVMLQSRHIYHKADVSTANKISIILTTHTNLVNRLCVE